MMKRRQSSRIQTRCVVLLGLVLTAVVFLASSLSLSSSLSVETSDQELVETALIDFLAPSSTVSYNIRRKDRSLEVQTSLDGATENSTNSKAISAVSDTAELEIDNSDTGEEVVDESSDLAVVVSFEDILRLTVFIAAAWAMSNLSVAVGLPGLVGEIITGFLLGPPLADFCPFPEAMVLIGNFGLLGLMLESGIHLDVAQLRETGTRAVFMALCGTLLALLTGLGLGFIPTAAGESTGIAAAMAVGACFAPSSLGVAAAVLSAGEVLNTPIGQLIVASSVVDDVLGLILLAILNVFVMDDPTAFNFVQPFLASFGFLIVLGYLGITWIPHVVQHKILPRVPPKQREKATFALMFTLMIVYLPLLNYSGASYLTGAFLAGLSFSQLPSIHSSYAHNGRELMVWLMRIFFAATIGFQVPILRYDNLYVLKWSAKFLVPVIAKIPLGLLVPRFRKEVPHDFPFDPYWRDAFITSLSVVCRGEFNFVVASFGLSNGLLDADIYSAIVMAVLVSSIFGPLLLSRTIRYYNRLAQEYLSMPHSLTRLNKSSTDGFRPLFIAIQIRTPTSWNMHERYQHVLQDLGLLILDHRTWHTNGLEAVAMSEIFVQDTMKNIMVKNCFDDSSERSSGSSNNPDAKATIRDIASKLAADQPDDTTESMTSSSNNASKTETKASGGESLEDGICAIGSAAIQQRLDQVQAALEACLEEDVDREKYAIKTTQWEPFIHEATAGGPGHHRQRTYTFHESDDICYKDEMLEDIFDDLSAPLSIEEPCTMDAVSTENEMGEDSGFDGCNRGDQSFDINESSETNKPAPTLMVSPLPRPILRNRAVSNGEPFARMPSTSSNLPTLAERNYVRAASHDVPAMSSPNHEHPRTPATSSIRRPDRLRNRGESHGSHSTPRRAMHHRRTSTLGQCDGQLDFDLWETDKVAHKCVRRGSCLFQPTVAGHAAEDMDEQLLALANGYASDNESDSDVDHPLHTGEGHHHQHGHHRVQASMDMNDEQETSAIQHLLHGYIRH